MGRLDDAERALQQLEAQQADETAAAASRMEEFWAGFEPETFELMKDEIYGWAGQLALDITEPDLTFHPYREYSVEKYDGGYYDVKVATHVTGEFWSEQLLFLAYATVYGQVGAITLGGLRIRLRDLPSPRIDDHIRDPIALARQVRRYRVANPEPQAGGRRRRSRRR